MKKEINFTQEDFELTLAWLNPNRDQAGIEYLKIRKGLTDFFYFKGFSRAEELADETINRVVRKISALNIDSAKPITIFHGFASKVYFEELRRVKSETPIDKDYPLEINEVDDSRHQCLEDCLNTLPFADKKLLLRYYSKHKSEKFDFRRELAEKEGVSVNTLHVKIHRFRLKLKKCVETCLATKY